MITTPTVFVLGAGASIPYGFPSGVQLFQEIYNKIESIKWIEKLHNSDFNIPRETISTFKRELFFSAKTSIDAFLENRTEYIKLGKLCIALALIPYEYEQNLFTFKNKDDNWYRYLFTKLS